MSDHTNKEAERAYVGALLLDNEQLKAIPPPPVAAFTDTVCARTLAAIERLVQEGKPADLLTVPEADHDLKKGDVAALTSTVPSSANAAHYARIIRDLYVRREVGRLGSELAGANGISGDEIMSQLRQRSASLDDILTAGADHAFEILEDVAEVSRQFHVHPHVPLDTVTVLAGEGDIGKGLTSSTLAAATTTAGGPWAGRAVLRQGGVFIISSEDDNPEWRRRIRVAGGDLKKVAIRGLEHTWDMLRTAEIEQSIRAAARQMGTDVQLLIIDNAGAYLPEGGNLNDNVLARACIGALNRLAAELHIAVVLVHHTRKGGASKNIDAVSGGMAWTQAPRSVVMMAEHPTEAEHKVLWVAKANWAKKPPMFELTIEDCDGTPKVAWIGETDIASASLMSEDATTVGNASQWLLKVLKSGPILSGDMEELAKEAGLSWSSVKRAKQSMPRVTSRKESTRDGNWCWVLL